MRGVVDEKPKSVKNNINVVLKKQKIQIPIWTLKLSNIRPGEYFDGRPLGNSRRCQQNQSFATTCKPSRWAADSFKALGKSGLCSGQLAGNFGKAVPPCCVWPRVKTSRQRGIKPLYPTCDHAMLLNFPFQHLLVSDKRAKIHVATIWRCWVL